MAGELDEIVIDPSPAPAAADADPQGDAPAGTPGKEPAAPAEPTIADVMKLVQEIKTTAGRVPALQSRLDSMPKQFEAMFQKTLRESTQQQYLNSLSPEQRQVYEQQQLEQQQQQDYLKRTVQEHIKETMGDQFASILERDAVAQDKEKADGFFEAIEQKLGVDESKRVGPFISEMLKEHRRKIDSGDPALIAEADKWMTRALNSPGEVALDALLALQKSVAAGEGKVIDERQARGRSMGAQPRGSAPAVPAASLKNLRDMSEKALLANPEIANMTTAEYEKLLKASK